VLYHAAHLEVKHGPFVPRRCPQAEVSDPGLTGEHARRLKEEAQRINRWSGSHEEQYPRGGTTKTPVVAGAPLCGHNPLNGTHFRVSFEIIMPSHAHLSEGSDVRTACRIGGLWVSDLITLGGRQQGAGDPRTCGCEAPAVELIAGGPVPPIVHIDPAVVQLMTSAGTSVPKTI
jgi:hypothetical protein